MTVLPTAKRAMRIIALPLTAPRKHASAGPEQLIYYHFLTPPPPPDKGGQWVKKAAAKVAELWAGFGKAAEGSWKRRTFVYGERLADRLDFEELALKSVDTSLAPSLVSSSAPTPADHPTIPLIYPPIACAAPLTQLKALLARRTPRHKTGFYTWMIIAPFTAPFMLIPIIPNLPFFFCAWRSWHHYRAYKASQYLETFLAQGAIVHAPLPALDDVYATHAPPLLTSTSPTSPSEAKEPPSPDESAPDTQKPGGASAAPPQLLLTRDAVPVLARVLELPQDSSFEVDVGRALDQAGRRQGK